MSRSARTIDLYIDQDVALGRRNRKRLLVECGDTYVVFEFDSADAIRDPEGIELVTEALVRFVRKIAVEP